MIFNLSEPKEVGVVQSYLKERRRHGDRVGLTSGCFDLIHPHHFFYLTRCKRTCDILIVGVDSDELVRETKGEGRPLVYDFRRALMADALKPVDFAFVMHDLEDFGRAAEYFTPDIIFRNEGFEGREEEVIGKEHSGAVLIVKDLKDHSSTTEIISAVRTISADSGE